MPVAMVNAFYDFQMNRIGKYYLKEQSSIVMNIT